MKRKLIPHVFAIIAVVTLVVLSVSCAIFSGGGGGGGDVVEVTWDEGITTGVTRVTNDGLQKNWVKVSPDGTKLLYTERNKSGNWTINYLRDATNPAKTPLVGEISRSPSWYEDNNRILYTSVEGGAGKLVRSTVTGGGRTYISRGSAELFDDTASIKNGLIVFSSWSGNQYNIATIKENGTETTFLGSGVSPTWHPTQNKILFIRPSAAGSFGGSIFEMDVNSGQATEIYNDPEPNILCFSPSYSPDGRRILFTKQTPVQARGTVTSGGRNRGEISVETIRTHMFIMNTDGTNVSPVSSGNASVISPSWGKDGEVFCLVGIPGQAFEIYRFRVRGN